jgi:hypothetical protein
MYWMTARPFATTQLPKKKKENAQLKGEEEFKTVTKWAEKKHLPFPYIQSKFQAVMNVCEM